MSDLENRVRDLERLCAQLGNTVIKLQFDVDRLQAELSHELTSKAIQSLRPWPTRGVTIGALNSGEARGARSGRPLHNHRGHNVQQDVLPLVRGELWVGSEPCFRLGRTRANGGCHLQ
jgi:hypothetical protein